jgi:hypothetical protein
MSLMNERNLRNVTIQATCVAYQFLAAALAREEKEEGVFTTLPLAPSFILLPAGLHLCFVLQTLLASS